MAHEPRHRAAWHLRVAGASCTAGLAIMAVLRATGRHARPHSSNFGSGDAGGDLLGDDHRPLVFADIDSRLGDLPHRSAAPGQTAHLTALLAPLSGRDASPLAAALLARFGSICAVAAASRRELAEVFGACSPVPDNIAAVRRLLHAGMRETVEHNPLDPTNPALLKFLVAHFSGLQHEELLALFADRDGGFLDQQSVAAGGADELAFEREVLFRRAAAIGARQIVLAHNHPSGKAEASAKDISATRRILRDCSLLGIVLRDHLIVANNRVFSMERAGLL